MHEMAITQSVIDAVCEHAAGAQVHSVLLEVGVLCAVVPEAMQFSTPGIPLGIFEKSSRPSSFCPLKQNGQWSVETTCRSSVRSPRQSAAWCSLGRSGVEQTYLAPSKSGSA
ncbi:hydrogenase/urease maturation nickel metallochaperone HypA, partial [Nocardia salmonicida]|uniref:hydrogenase/urease maturation nickel metallochaperone HypA n=1 Tax=Nocardia salmonicida TaxID=53431 RepID=UPI003648C98D